MKNLGFLSLVLFAATAFAGQGTCNSARELICQVTYQLADGTSVAGPSATAMVQDIQPEPFDPADCEASVVLYTAVGKVVATYNQQSGMISGFTDQNGKETSFAESVTLDQVVPAAVKGSDPAAAHVLCKYEHN